MSMSLRSILMSDDPATVLRTLDDEGTLRDLEPSLADLRMSIPAGYRHKDNLVHSIRVLNYAIERETEGADLVLRTAALFHDVGKPATREFHGKGRVTFEAHEIAGARMIRKILVRHGYSKSEISEISTLIAYHMRSHGFADKDWSDSAVRRLITDAGSEERMNRLMILFYSDITTGSDEKRARLHSALDVLGEKIAAVRALDARRALRPALSGHDVMEIFGLKPGKELGAVMKFLNSDEGVVLSVDEAKSVVKAKFFSA